VISAFRVLLIPAIVALILVERRRAAYVAAGVFAIGAMTDGLDGYLARRYGTKTRTGQWLDPLADKLFVFAPAVTLTALGRFPLLALVVLMAREAGIQGLRAYLGTRGRPMPASPGAKWKTVLQLTAITLYILPLPAFASPYRLAVLIAAVILTVATGLDYALRVPGWLRESRSGPRDDGSG
jgi:CDP-diacylglycerol---glycerol-3-phosphate 3-phosphatidyltransferase